jgi:hypothetical protein
MPQYLDPKTVLIYRPHPVFANILGGRQYFMILLDFVAANICVYFQYLFMHLSVRQYF